MAGRKKLPEHKMLSKGRRGDKRGRMESKIVNRKEGCEEDIQRRKK